ncbi:MAG: hypothetical protein HY901_38635 [Deltaproteobacteria bacterium]|nr:hypothetical protein [Deltaproteobacteria bacterium]
MKRLLGTVLLAAALVGCESEMDLGNSPDGGSVGNAISVYPVAPTIEAESQQTFTAFGVQDPFFNLSWSILEGSAGGSVDAMGNYTAPGTAGGYHLKVALKSDPSVSTTVPIIVTTTPVVSVSVNPALAPVGPGSRTLLDSRIWGDTPSSSDAHRIEWNVAEGSGGTLQAASGDASAIYYSAPTTPGISYIEAVAKPDDTKSAFVTVIVE